MCLVITTKKHLTYYYKLTHIVLIIMTQKVVTFHYFVKVYINYFQEISFSNHFYTMISNENIGYNVWIVSLVTLKQSKSFQTYNIYIFKLNVHQEFSTLTQFL
jgi:hypothetical protein